MKVYLKKDIIKELDSTALAVYVALKSIYTIDTDYYCISVNRLCYELCNNTSYSRKFKDKIVNGLDSLVQLGLVSIEDNFTKTEFLLNLSKLYFKDEFFVMIDTDTVHTLFNIDDNTDKFSLLKYLITVLGTINVGQGTYNDAGEYVTNIVGWMSNEFNAKESGIHIRSVPTYNDILEDNLILFIYKHENYITDESGQIKSICNHYGLYEDKDLITKFALDYEKKLGIVSKGKKNDNHNRSLSMKYNYMLKGKTYNANTVKEIKEYIHNKNKDIQKEIDTNEKLGYDCEELRKRLKDESIFRKDE